MERCYSIDNSPPVDGGAECVRALKALAHPIRFAVLVALGRGDLSPSQFARSRGEPVSNVSYHFRLLAELGLIELARTRPVRGSIEHIYRAARPPGEGLESTGAGGDPFVLAPADLVALVAWIAERCQVGRPGRP